MTTEDYIKTWFLYDLCGWPEKSSTEIQKPIGLRRWWAFTVCQLQVSQRIVYKVCIVMYRCLHQTATKYLQELFVPVVPTTASRRHLRSTAGGDLQKLATMLCKGKSVLDVELG